MTQLGRRSPTFTLLRQTLLTAGAIAVLCSVSTTATAATVTDLKAVHRNGQTFITFTKNAGSGPKTTYDVYRHTSPITNLSGVTKVATLDADSWHLLYDDRGASPPRLSNGFIVTDDGPPLTSTQGLLVWTTETSGNYYYAVVNSNDPATIAVGTNSLATAVSEVHQTVPGAVRLQAPINNGTNTCYKYYRWEDYSTWQTRQWGYYGQRFNVYAPTIGLTPPYPILLELHSAVGEYYEPSDNIGHLPVGLEIYPRDIALITGGDPYAVDNRNYGHSNWFGRYDSVSDRQVPITERRITDYIKMVRDNGTGDSTNFQADATRIYVNGASMGAGAMHVASHYPTLFAAASTSIGYVDATGYGGIGGSLTTLVEGTDIEWQNWEDMKWLADNGYRMPPIAHTFNKDDPAVRPANYPAALMAFERARLPYVAQWHDGGHSQFGVDNGAAAYGSGHRWDPMRFQLDESYPAFSNASTSDPVGTAPQAAGAPGNTGQRNLYLDWGSELHPIGDPIEDTVNKFGITLKSVSVDTSADVTIRNAQQFRPDAGQRVDWRNESQPSGQVLQSGSVAADGQGLVTIRLQITAAGNRLTLSCAACTASVASKVSPPTNVRIVRP